MGEPLLVETLVNALCLVDAPAAGVIHIGESK
jgi:hypothetical protein